MTTTTSSKPRPLSPHLRIYKRQISSVMSILHRITGVGLALGLPLLVVWLLILSGGQDVYDFFIKNILNIVGQTILVGVFFLGLSYSLSFLNIIVRLIRPSSEPLKWFLVFVDFIAALVITKLTRDYLADAFPDGFDKVCAPIGLIALVGWTWAFSYHFCCGIRHLMWDAGWFLTIKGMHVTGWITLLISAAATVILWLKINPEGTFNVILGILA